MEFVYGFGCNLAATPAASVASETQLLYTVGRKIVSRNIANGRMHELPSSPKRIAVNTLAVSPCFQYVAVGEVLEGGALGISVWSLLNPPSYRRVKFLPLAEAPPQGAQRRSSSSDGAAQEISCVAFSADSKLMAAHVRGGDDPTLHVLHWRGGAAPLSAPLPGAVTALSFNPLDSTQVASSGPSSFRLWRANNDALRVYPPFRGLPRDAVITGHGWTGDHRLVAVSAGGAVYVVDDCVVTQCLEASDGHGAARSAHEGRLDSGRAAVPSAEDLGRRAAPPRPAACACLAMWRKGFIVGGAEGLFQMYAPVDVVVFDDAEEESSGVGEEEGGSDMDTAAMAGAVIAGVRVHPNPNHKKRLFEHCRSFIVATTSPVDVLGLSLSPSGDVLAVSTAAGIGVASLTVLETLPEEDTAAPLTWCQRGMQLAPVSSMSIASHRPVLATASWAGSSLVVWDYGAKSLIAEVSTAPSQPLQVLVHDSGFMLLVVFPSRVTVYYILMDGLEEAHTISVKNAVRAVFSPGGSHFAVVAGKDVALYRTFGPTGPEPVALLHGHSRPVVGACWLAEGAALVSAANDGAVYGWATGSGGERGRSAEAPLLRGAEVGGVASAAPGLVGCNAIMKPSTLSSWLQDAEQGTVTPPAGMSQFWEAAQAGEEGKLDGGNGLKSAKSNKSLPRMSSQRPLPGGGGGGGKNAKLKGKSDGAGRGAAALMALPPPLRLFCAWEGSIEAEAALFVAPRDMAVLQPQAPSQFDLNRVKNRGDDSGGDSDSSDRKRGSAFPQRHLYSVWGASSSGELARFSFPGAEEARQWRLGPLTLDGDLVEEERWALHEGRITDVCTTSDGVFVFTAGEDGTVIMMAITDAADQHIHRLKDRHLLMEANPLPGLRGAEGTNLAAAALEKRSRQLELLHPSGTALVLLPLPVLQHAQERVERLKVRLVEVERSKAEELKEARLRHETDMKTKEKEWSDERTRLEKLRDYDMDAKDAEIKKLTASLDQNEKRHMEAIDELEHLYEKKILSLETHGQGLQRQLDDAMAMSEAREADLKSSTKATQSYMLEKFKEKVSEQRQAQDDLKSYLEYVKTEYEEMLAQQDKDHDMEVLRLKGEIEGLQAKVYTVEAKAKGEQAQLQRAMQQLKDSAEKASGEHELMLDKQREERAKKEAVVQKLKAADKELEEARMLIRDRDAKLGECERSIKELERSRRILQQQLSEVRAALQPRDEEIQLLRAHIHELDEEYHKRNTADVHKDERLHHVQHLHKTTKDELKKTKTDLEKANNTIRRFKHALDMLVSNANNLPDASSLWRDGVAALHEQYVLGVQPPPHQRSGAGRDHFTAALNKALSKRHGGASDGRRNDSNAAASADSGGGRASRLASLGDLAGGGRRRTADAAAMAQLKSAADRAALREALVSEEHRAATAEFQRQQRFMHEKLAAVEHIAAVEREKGARRAALRMSESSTLIADLNRLRRDKVELQKRVNALETQLSAAATRRQRSPGKAPRSRPPPPPAEAAAAPRGTALNASRPSSAGAPKALRRGASKPLLPRAAGGFRSAAALPKASKAASKSKSKPLAQTSPADVAGNYALLADLGDAFAAAAEEQRQLPPSPPAERVRKALSQLQPQAKEKRREGTDHDDHDDGHADLMLSPSVSLPSLNPENLTAHEAGLEKDA